MYGLRPFDGMGYAPMWIPDQVRDDNGASVLFKLTMVFIIGCTKSDTVTPDLIRDPFMDEVHIIIPCYGGNPGDSSLIANFFLCSRLSYRALEDDARKEEDVKKSTCTL